ncbi:alpha/beta hydrolase [Cereibacter sphaeroides]|uniref:alpha/beta family hydrolase n=1 Tax=Cereibacter sphaeroides TaxID=1063 RepID=UPI001F1E5B30|nr:alpha/beta family hydrolase [Cereibacter sphaeroides]MCE6958364.1 alpha/beta hydrolase [Cereibacter sphaeroides]MCE6972231.1 alpha/beta hydrolase [Cereibacter sphaeroides]
MEFRIDGPPGARATLLLAHGAGAGMASPAMQMASAALAAAGLQVLRFEFDYMAARRAGRRKPPPRAEFLTEEFLAAVAAADVREKLVIGGKSMGGRVASLVADELHAAGTAAGLFCLGYPFHPAGKPDQLRTQHLERLTVPSLICQGTRDPFGSRAEVAGYALSDSIRIIWLEDGDHDLKPRRLVTGLTQADHFATMARKVAAWTETLPAPPR